MIEEKKFISKQNFEKIYNGILDNTFPWYYTPYSTSYKYPFFAHTLKPRNGQKNSLVYDFFIDIVDSFCQVHNIKYTEISRACLNLVTYHSDRCTDFHVDHDFAHKVFLIYLTDGETLIKKDGKEISKKCEQGTVLCFDGLLQHAGTFPKEGERRVVCVVTVKVEEKKRSQVEILNYFNNIVKDIKFKNHCIGVYNHLKKMGCSDDLCNAGLFHSFYGTEFFNPKLEVDRLKLVDIIGYKAEQIVYDFCQLKDRDEFLLKNIHNNKDLFFINLANLLDLNIEKYVPRYLKTYERFNYWSNVWKENNLPWDIKTHDINLENFLNTFNIKNGKVLELGCGFGYDTKFLDESGFDVTGLDISKNAIDIAKKNNSLNVKFKCIDFFNYDTENNFDLIYDRACLHGDFEPIEEYFLKCSSLLKNGGHLCVITGCRSDNHKFVFEQSQTNFVTNMNIEDIKKHANKYFNNVTINEVEFKQGQSYEDGMGYMITGTKK